MTASAVLSILAGAEAAGRPYLQSYIASVAVHLTDWLLPLLCFQTLAGAEAAGGGAQGHGQGPRQVDAGGHLRVPGGDVAWNAMSLWAVAVSGC